MGEYARYGGQSIKIGTCEDMLYLRADQVRSIQPQRGSVDPSRPDTQRVIRFRFPWPDEDGTPPGGFHADGPDRAVTLDGDGITLPADLDHLSVQFVAQAGYNVCLPCPEGPSGGHGLTVHRNGFAGRVRLVQQAYRGGQLVVICECGGCGARYNIPTLAEAEPLIAACRQEAARRERRNESGAWWTAVAERIRAGYTERPIPTAPSPEEATR
jgi:hypothetical protein